MFVNLCEQYKDEIKKKKEKWQVYIMQTGTTNFMLEKIIYYFSENI